MAEDSGRRMDVLVERHTYRNQYTGLPVYTRDLHVTADAGHKKNIEAVEGVQCVYQHFWPTFYDVRVDERYDIDVVAKNIEAAILCNEPEARNG